MDQQVDDAEATRVRERSESVGSSLQLVHYHLRGIRTRLDRASNSLNIV